MPENSSDFYRKLPACFEESPCGYFEENTSGNLITTVSWLKSVHGEQYTDLELAEKLMVAGFRRCSDAFYVNQCKKCSQCIPIRLMVEDFKMSKNQRAAWNKNQDLEITLQKEVLITEEKAFLYRNYDAFHNKGRPDYIPLSQNESRERLEELNRGYSGIWNMEYRLNGTLVGVAILDVAGNHDGRITALSSNYFYYDVSDEIRKRSIGVFSVLKEIELCRQLDIPVYYLGLFLPDCRKMNYKTNYKPYQLLLKNGWTSFNKVELPGAGELYTDFEDVAFVTDEITTGLLYNAYHQGIFPWFNEDEGDPVIWQSPDPRFVIFPELFHVPASADKFLKHTPYTYTKDKCFGEVMLQCSLMKRKGQNGTWIGPKMLDAYEELHRIGMAHSYEVWHDDKLVGGFYGVDLGNVFCGESMFTVERDSAKSAFIRFARDFFEKGGKLIDCQVYTDNMARFGAVEIPREKYLALLKKYTRY